MTIYFRDSEWKIIIYKIRRFYWADTDLCVMVGNGGTDWLGEKGERRKGRFTFSLDDYKHQKYSGGDYCKIL